MCGELGFELSHPSQAVVVRRVGTDSI